MAKKKSTLASSRKQGVGPVGSSEKERYQQYLCSREWAVLKEAVHKRAHGICERCRVFPIDAVHHLTYERKYHESLEDLQGHCDWCHKFTHGKSDFDPAGRDRQYARYALSCRDQTAVPYEFYLGSPSIELGRALMAINILIDVLNSGVNFDYSDVIERGIIAMNESLPFNYYAFKRLHLDALGDVARYRFVMNLLGVSGDDFEWNTDEEE